MQGDSEPTPTHPRKAALSIPLLGRGALAGPLLGGVGVGWFMGSVMTVNTIVSRPTQPNRFRNASAILMNAWAGG